MNDDPTRIMSNGDGDPGRDDGPHYSPEDKQRHLRYLVIGLLAVIAGLIVAVVIISPSTTTSMRNTPCVDG